MDILQLYRDYGIPFVTEGEKHARPGWVNAKCPFCTGNPGYHLGYEIRKNYHYCFRCGWHPVVETIAKLLRVPTSNAIIIVKQYKGTTKGYKLKDTKKKEFFLPAHTILTDRHKNYLIDRNFDPEYIEKVWGVVGTGPISLVDGIDYKNRVLAPVFWDSKIVSYVARDITGKHKKKYLVCPKNREIIHHKQILYGLPEFWKQTGICVEGITDTWRFGLQSFATFGIEFKHVQVRWMAKLFTRVAVAYDIGPQAAKQADKLVAELKLRNVDAFRVLIEDDPGSMSQKEADYLVKQII